MVRRRLSFKKWAAVRFAGPYVFLRSVYHSNTLRLLSSAPFYPLDRLRQSGNSRYFPFDIHSSMGMGAVLTHTVKLLKYADDNGLRPVVAFTTPIYAAKPGADWFGDYFELNAPYQIDAAAKARLSFLKIAHEYSAGAFAVPTRMELAEANRIFFKYIKIKKTIYDIVDQLTHNLKDGLFDLSIHYRGTDKNLEANPAAYADVAAKMEGAMRGGLDVKNVFLATDDLPFGAYIKNRFKDIAFASYYAGGETLDPSQPRHFSDMPGDAKAIEALVNIVAISRSPVCIRTCSYLSGWSKILNPGMKTYSLNRPHQGFPLFPEKEIWATEAEAPASAAKVTK